MTTALSPSPKQQFFDAAGVPLVGGKLYTYAAGTSTPIATYTDSSGIVSNTNPVILDSRGEANIWLAPATAYKFVLKDSTDATIWTVDNVDLGINFSNVIITGGSINGATIGNITPAAGTFTDLTATGTVSFTSDTQMRIPAGPTSSRAEHPTIGMIRYNSTTSSYEGATAIAGAAISTLTHVGTTATLTTSTFHGLTTGAFVTVSGVTPTNYNSSYTVTVVNDYTFTYTMISDPGADASVLGSYVAYLWQGIGGGGATGGGYDEIFVENGQTVTTSYSIPSGKSASSTGPITINSGITVIVPTGSRWVVI